MNDELNLSPDDARIASRFYTEESMFHRLVMRVFIPLVRSLIIDLRISGSENVLSEGAFILAINHITMYDVVTIQSAIPLRTIFYMAKEELFRNPLTGWLYRELCAFPIYRGAADRWAMGFAMDLLKNGQVVGVFPEGTRSRARGLMRAKSGAAKLAIDSGCPIIPMSIEGTQHLFSHSLRQGKGMFHRTRVNVNIGAAIYPQPTDRIFDLTQRMMIAIAKMLPESMQGRYAEYVSNLD